MKTKILPILLSFLIFAVSLNYVSAYNWVNVTDGFSTVDILGSNVEPHGIASNGSDIWIVDSYYAFINHLDKNYNNLSDGFSASALGCNQPRGLFFNGTQLISVDDADESPCVFNLDGTAGGGNGVDLYAIFYPEMGMWMSGVTGNESDLWITEGQSGAKIFHLLPDYTSGGVEVNIYDITGWYAIRGVVTNGTDFYFIKGNDGKGIYHIDKNGVFYENFSVAPFGNTEPTDLAFYQINDVMNEPINDMWVVSITEKFIFHIRNTDVPNEAPYFTNLQITPAVAYANSTLNCSANYNDAESDIGSVTIRWDNSTYSYTNTVSGVNSGDMVSLQLIYSVSKGETWNCSINATDGTNTIITSTTREVSNSIPNIDSIILNVPLTNADIPNCTVIASDIDTGELLTVNITWKVNGAYLSSVEINTASKIQVSTTIPAQSSGSNLTCEAFAYDGEENSAIESITTTIGTAPTPKPSKYISCPNGNTLCYLIEGSGAGLGVFIQYMATALPPLLIILAIVGVIAVVGGAIGRLIGSKITE